MISQRNLYGIHIKNGLYDKLSIIQISQSKLDESSVYTQTTVNFFAYDSYFCIERDAPFLNTFKLLMEKFVVLSDRIPSTTPGAEPPRDAKDSGSARSHSTHLETSSSDPP